MFQLKLVILDQQTQYIAEWDGYEVNLCLKLLDFPTFVFFGCKIDNHSQTTNSLKYSPLGHYV